MEFKVTKLSKISNVIFLIFTLFVLSFIWTQFYFKNLNLSLIISIPISLAIYLSYYPIKKYIEKTKEQKNKLKQSREELILNLCLGKEDIINEYLLKVFEYTNITKLTPNHYQLDSKKEIVFSFQKESLDQETYNDIIRKRTTDNIVIFCIKSNVLYSPKDINIEVIDIDKIYPKLAKTDTSFPVKTELKKQPKYRLKDVLCIVFNKSKANKYFYTALLIIFTSLFTPFTNYYIIISTILIIASIYSRFNTRFN